MLKERKYRVIQIYKNLNDYQANRKMEKPKVLGVYSGIGVLKAIYEAAKDTGIYMDCLTAEEVKSNENKI